MISKSIKTLAWDVPEEEYRASPAFSYSTLSTFEREGPRIIPNIYDKKTSEALRFGSLVDTLLTAPEEFEDKFYIVKVKKPSDTIYAIINNIWEESDKQIDALIKIPEGLILNNADRFNYGMTWRKETRVNKILTEGSDFFKTFKKAENKIIIPQEDYVRANSCIEALKTSKYTRDAFYDDIFEEDIESHYQLKFKAYFEDIDMEVRIMLDRLKVDHANKIIYPKDLKTTGKDEEHFADSFLTWNYWIQSNMYSEVLAKVISQDDYFKDFTIAPFEFICINRYNISPLIWVDNTNLIPGDRLDIHGIRHSYWKKLCTELKWHMDNKIYNYTYDSIVNGGKKILNNIKVINE